jgi:Flp pilus assembly protein TadG
MIPAPQAPVPWPWSLARALARRLRGDAGAQIVEFAISVPLLVLFVVGIFDFSNAISLKQKLTNAAREGARVAASDPSADLSNSSAGLPVAISDAFQVLDNYLVAEKINDCGLSTQTPIQTGVTLVWTVTTTGCPGGANAQIVLTIDRGCITNVASLTTDLVDTCVTLSYPYTWRFTSASTLFGGSIIPPSKLSTTAVAMNEN